MSKCRNFYDQTNNNKLHRYVCKCIIFFKLNKSIAKRNIINMDKI